MILYIHESWFTINEKLILSWAKSVLMSLELATAALATDVAIQKKFYGSGITTLIISNEEMKHIM